MEQKLRKIRSGCAELELTGRNSVKPSTIPNMSDSKLVRSIIPPRTT